MIIHSCLDCLFADSLPTPPKSASTPQKSHCRHAYIHTYSETSDKGLSGWRTPLYKEHLVLPNTSVLYYLQTLSMSLSTVLKFHPDGLPGKPIYRDIQATPTGPGESQPTVIYLTPILSLLHAYTGRQQYHCHHSLPESLMVQVFQST